MSTDIALHTNGKAEVSAYEMALVSNDLSKLAPAERQSYYMATCQSLGLNHLTQPFQYINLSGKLTLYATRACTDQLRKINGVSLTVVAREKIGDLYSVSVRAEDKTGRVDESTGVVTLSNLKGDALANALMKAETKAKRRATLSICGLGWLDETELETVSTATRVSFDDAQAAPSPAEIAVQNVFADEAPRAPVPQSRPMPYTGDPQGPRLKPASDKSRWKLFFDLKNVGYNWPFTKKGDTAAVFANVDEVAMMIAGHDRVTALTLSEAIKAVELKGLQALSAPGQGEYLVEADVSDTPNFDDEEIPF